MFEICFEFQNFAILCFGVHTTGFDSQLALKKAAKQSGGPATKHKFAKMLEPMKFTRILSRIIFSISFQFCFS